MNNKDDDLKRTVLRGMVAPRSAAARRDAALCEALAALPAPHPVPFCRPRIARPPFRVMAKYAAAIMVGAFFTWWCIPRQSPPTAPVDRVATAPEISLETLHEISRMFPDQINAIIAGPSGIDLRLLSTGGTATDQVVRIIVSNDHEIRTIITYSGRSVSLDFAGSPLSLTPLINGDGAVIVLTGDRVFLGAADQGREGLRVLATTLAQQ